MNALAVLLAAALVSQTPPAKASRSEARAGDVAMDAGRIVYDLGTGEWVLEGGAVLRRGEAVLRAARARFDPATGAIDASGGVLLTDPHRAVAAESVHAVLGGAFDATDVVAFVKGEPVALGDADSVEVARRLGRNRLSFTGGKVGSDAGGRLRVQGARLTLCDCGLGRAPSWEVRAKDADVVPGKRAILRGATVYVTPRFLGITKPVPVLPLPWLYVPLGDRQTGVLLPEFRSPLLSQPVFVTLGPSADLTLTPLFAWTFSDAAPVRGPGAELEGRWAPWPGTTGFAQLRWVQDLDGASGPNGAGDGGARVMIRGEHVQRVSDRTRLRADVALFDDPFQIRDFGADQLARATDYTRSTFLAEHRRADAVLSLDAAYYLRMRGELAPDFGAFGSGLDTTHRWPSLEAELLPTAIAGPLRLAGRAGLGRWAPLEGEAAAPRTATNRADARAELSAPVRAGDLLVVEPFVRGAAVARLADAQGDTTSAWGVGGVALSTELARGASARVRHAITPRVEWRAGSGVAGDAPAGPALDAWDVGAPRSTDVPQLVSALPGGAFQQLRVSLENRLTVGGVDVLDLEVGQDLDLRRGTLAELWGRGSLAAGPFTARGTVRGLPFDARPGGAPAHRFDSVLDRFTELRLDARLGDRRGDFLQAGLISVGPGGSGLLVAGVEPLFDLRPAFEEPVAQATAGAQVAIGGATVGYGVWVPGRRTAWPSCTLGNPDVVLEPLEATQHAATFGWDSPCHCFRMAVRVLVDRCGNVSPTAMFDLSALGGRLFRTAGAAPN